MFTHKINKFCISLSRHISTYYYYTPKMNLSIQQKKSKMKLYYDDISPPVRSVLMLINELNLTDEVDLIFTDLFKGEHLTKEYLQVSFCKHIPYNLFTSFFFM